MSDTPTFAGLGLAPSLLEALAARGITEPMPVQAAAIPPGLEGRDLLVQSRTGSGKTFAFGLPLLQRLQPERHPQALVLAPTRELAQQVALELRRLRAVEVTLLVGGLGYGPQLKSLEKGCPVVVGTPGRVKDHLERGTLDLSHVAMVVLDECDEMLNMGFLEDVEEILSKAPGGPQTFLFSATLPAPIAHLAGRFLKNPVKLNLAEGGQAPAHADIAHTPVQVPDALQVKALVNLLLHDEPSAALIFTKTKQQTEEVAEHLTVAGLPAAFLHGDLAQGTRQRILDQFKRGQLRYLVATDVAARGLDISGLPLVVHVGIPTQLENYVHRSGRTGRAGAKGTSLALVNQKESRILFAWSKRGGLTLLWRGVPGPEEIRAAQAGRLEQTILEGATDARREQAARLLAGRDAEAVVAGLLGLLRGGDAEGFALSLPPFSGRFERPARKPFDRTDRPEHPGSRSWSRPGAGETGGKPEGERPWRKKTGAEGERPWTPRKPKEGAPERPWKPRKEEDGRPRKAWDARKPSEGRPFEKKGAHGPSKGSLPKDKPWKKKKD